MAIWSTDLTTEDGALGAAQMGSFACIFSAIFAGFYVLILFGVTAGDTPSGPDAILPFLKWFFAAEVIVFALAAILLRSGKGAIPAIAGSILLGLEVLVKIAGLALSIALVIDIILLIFTVNGARGALALRKGIFNDEEAAEIFR